MSLHPRQFVRFLDGRLGVQAVVAFLPLDIGAHMPTVSTDVRMGFEYGRKLLEKHSLRYEDFLRTQAIIDRGFCIRSQKMNHLEFFYVDGMIGTIYLLVLKSARHGNETWVVTLFRSNRQQMHSRLRRARGAGSLIRAHLWD